MATICLAAFVNESGIPGKQGTSFWSVRRSQPADWISIPAQRGAKMPSMHPPGHMRLIATFDLIERNEG